MTYIDNKTMNNDRIEELYSILNINIDNFIKNDKIEIVINKLIENITRGRVRNWKQWDKCLILEKEEILKNIFIEDFENN